MADPVVTTAYGQVRGFEQGGVFTFLGMPYGASTAAENRFRAPKPPAPWTGVREATEYGPGAPFTTLPLPARGPMAVAGANPTLSPAEVSEDCLTINVWTSTLDQTKRLPVIVVMPHYAMGSAMGDLRQPASGGEVVAVSFTHRGGISGHLYLAELGSDDYAESGNAGTLDIVLGLEWIRDNIEAFGGDPSRVMVYGCSGQASEITMVSGVPAAQGLFQRALISDGFLRGIPPFLATMMADRVLTRLEIAPTQLDKLHRVPWQQLHEAAAFPTDLAESLTAPIPFQSYWQFYPVIDGVVLPEEPYSHGSPASSADVPMILGWAHDSLNMINSSRPWVGHLDETGLMILAENHLGADLAQPILAAERRARPEASPTELALALINDRTMMTACVRMGEQRLIGAAAPTWMYRFDYTSPLFGGLWGALHGGEFSFFLNSVDAGAFGPRFANLYQDRADRLEVQTVLHESFLRFAHDGDPGTKALPAWAPYDTVKRPVMLLDSPCRLEEDPGRELRELYADVDWVSGPGDYRRSLVREGFAA
jgi:para-nitrobenzyl esterase